jgi:hypothetical protein
MPTPMIDALKMLAFPKRITVTNTSTLLSTLLTTAGGSLLPTAMKITLQPDEAATGTIYFNNGTATSSTPWINSGGIGYCATYADVATWQFITSTGTIDMLVTQEG